MRIFIEVGNVAINIGRLNMVHGQPLGLWVAWERNVGKDYGAPRFIHDWHLAIPGTGA